MNQINQNNTENPTWAPRITPRRLGFEENQDVNFDRELNIFLMERFERRTIVDNRQQNNFIFFSKQKYHNNLKNNY